MSLLPASSSRTSSGPVPGTFTTNEVEFLAEDAIITIIPNFRQDEIDLLDGQTYGPFRPSLPVDVPFWLAIHLKKARKCQIQPPGWLDATWLKDIHRREVEDGAFQEMPPHYLEIAHTMMQVASDDIQDVEGVRKALKLVEDARVGKVMTGLQKLQPGTTHVGLRNISSLELHTIRGFLLTAMNSFKDITTAEQGTDPALAARGLAVPPPAPGQSASASASSASSPASSSSTSTSSAASGPGRPSG